MDGRVVTSAAKLEIVSPVWGTSRGWRGPTEVGVVSGTSGGHRNRWRTHRSGQGHGTDQHADSCYAARAGSGQGSRRTQAAAATPGSHCGSTSGQTTAWLQTRTITTLDRFDPAHRFHTVRGCGARDRPRTRISVPALGGVAAQTAGGVVGLLRVLETHRFRFRTRAAGCGLRE